MNRADFPHPLPRRHGTGVAAIAKIAADRARGWEALAHVFDGANTEAKHWALTRALDDFDAARG